MKKKKMNEKRIKRRACELNFLIVDVVAVAAQIKTEMVPTATDIENPLKQSWQFS